MIPFADFLYEFIINFEMGMETLLETFFLFWLCSAFFEKQNAKGKSNRGFWLVPLSYFISMIIFQLIPVEFSSFQARLWACLAAFLVMAVIWRGVIYQKVFLSVTFFSLSWQARSFVNYTHLVLFDAETKFFNQVSRGRYGMSWKWNMVHIGVYMLAGLCFNGMIFALLAKWIMGKFPWRNRNLSEKEKAFLLVPGLSGAASYFFIRWIINKYNMIEGKDIFGEYPYFGFMILCMNLLVILSTMVVLNLFADLEQKREEETKQAVLQHQLQEMQNHIKDMEQLYSGIQGMKHDIKNHITVVEELIARQQIGEAKDYLKSMNHVTESLDYVYKTGNPVTDVIIQGKYKRAVKNGIWFESTFNFPILSDIDVFDISIILNNALENALEAAKTTEEGYIKVSSVLRKQTFLIEIVNSFCSVLEFEQGTGLPVSTKAEAVQHGMGLKNIQKVAEKYCGALEVEVLNQEFILTVMMQGIGKGGDKIL